MDYLHCNKDGKDILTVIKPLSEKDQDKARKSKDSYCKTLISFINDESVGRNNFGTFSMNNFYIDEDWNI